MEKRILGKTGLEVSVLGFGGAEIGYSHTDQKTVDRLLNTALDAGLNVIDTAECYVDSEEKIGKAISHRRGEFHLFTKVGHPGGLGTQDWSREGILGSVERSLQRLRTDRVDVVHLHSCSEAELRRGDVIEALQEAQRRGHTRFMGYSGDNAAARFAIGTELLDTLQTSISIADQEAIDLTLPAARERNMGVIAKRPLANAAWRTGKKPSSSYHHVYWDRLQELKYPFLRPKSDDAYAFALRFTLSLPGVHTAIVGTTNPERVPANARLLEAGALPVETVEEIRSHWHEVSKGEWVGQI